MLALTRKVDYALGALAYLAGHVGRVSSAREIATAGEMPVALCMKILKLLHRGGVVESTRGVKGGYVLGRELETVSLRDLVTIVEGAGALRAVGRSCCGKEEGEAASVRSPMVRGPVEALNYRLIGFLSQVKVSDLVMPGRRIDVPVELLGRREGKPVRGLSGRHVPVPSAVRGTNKVVVEV